MTGWQTVAMYHTVDGSYTKVVSLENRAGMVISNASQGYSVELYNNTGLALVVGIRNATCRSQGEYICAIIAGPLENPIANVSDTAFVNVSGGYHQNGK